MPSVSNQFDAPGPEAPPAVLYEMMLFYKASMENAQAQALLDRSDAKRARTAAGHAQTIAHEAQLNLRRAGDVVVRKHQGAYRLKRCFEEVVDTLVLYRTRVEPELNNIHEWLDDRMQGIIQRAGVAIEMVNLTTNVDHELPDLIADEMLEGPATPIDLTGEETETDDEFENFATALTRPPQ